MVFVVGECTSSDENAGNDEADERDDDIEDDCDDPESVIVGP